jgi:hypothetical protein
MSDSARLRLIPGGDGSSRGRNPRRRPGPAVLLVLFYALLFAAGLWLIRAKTRTQSGGGRPVEATLPAAERHARAELLSGAWIPAARRSRYFARLASECCTCGCDLSVHDCLEGDASCARSPELAEAIGRSLMR